MNKKEKTISVTDSQIVLLTAMLYQRKNKIVVERNTEEFEDPELIEIEDLISKLTSAKEIE